jgi:hypothetical protein
LPQAEVLKQQDIREMFSGEAYPSAPWSVNAYLGAFPIAAALDAGADIVLTGRCVDSALALGPLIHEFKWSPTDYDQLAAGSLAGHVIECGTQGTGGIITDWKTAVGDWDRMGFPIAVCAADGSFIATKPSVSGGRVVPESVAEQIVYEIGDPARYLLPDVTCDFSQVRLKQISPDHVEVTGARGRAPTGTYKVSATYQDGFRATGTMMIGGHEAVARAEQVGEAILKRTRRLFEQRKLGDYRRTDIEVLGAEANWGAHARTRNTREVILKLAVHHDKKDALEVFSREFIPAATSMAQSITGFSGGRPSVTPLVRLFSHLIPKSSIDIRVEVDGKPVALAPPHVPAATSEPSPAAANSEHIAISGPSRTVPLIAIAYGRSGDKGDSANIGVLARRSEFLPLLRSKLTAEAVKQYFAHFVKGDVERYELPGLHGFNFLMGSALGGGGMASLRYDPQGKMLAQILMDFPIEVPAEWIAHGWIDPSVV